jgi:hypothetical protein
VTRPRTRDRFGQQPPEHRGQTLPAEVFIPFRFFVTFSLAPGVPLLIKPVVVRGLLGLLGVASGRGDDPNGFPVVIRGVPNPSGSGDLELPLRERFAFHLYGSELTLEASLPFRILDAPWIERQSVKQIGERTWSLPAEVVPSRCSVTCGQHDSPLTGLRRSRCWLSALAHAGRAAGRSSTSTIATGRAPSAHARAVRLQSLSASTSGPQVFKDSHISPTSPTSRASST